MEELKVIKIHQDDTIGLAGAVEHYMRAQFMVGASGPFTVRVPRSATWDTDLRLAIEEEARRVRTLLP